jgi:tetratricopeptide (TPR) repeat protein
MLLVADVATPADDGSEHITAAAALAAEGKYEQAIAELDKVVSPNANTDATLHLMRGQYLEKLERPKEALNEYKAVISQGGAGQSSRLIGDRFAATQLSTGTLLEGAQFLADELWKNPTNEVAFQAALRLLQSSKEKCSLQERQEAVEVLYSLVEDEAMLEAAAAEATGRPAALETLERLVASMEGQPESAWLKFRLAKLYADGGPCVKGYDRDGAWRMFREVIETDPGTEEAADAHLMLAIQLPREALEERMQHWLAAAEILSPEEMEGRRGASINNLVAPGIISGRIESVKLFLESVLARKVNAETKEAAMGWKKFLASGMQLSDASVRQLLALAKEYRSLREYEKIMVYADEVLRRNPGREFFIAAKSLKRDCYRSQEKLEEALQMALDVLEAYPQKPHELTMMYVAWTYRLMGEHAKALEWAGRVIETFPGTKWEAQALRVMGSVSSELGDHDTAIWAFQQVLDKFPKTQWAAWAEMELRRAEMKREEGM